MSYSEAEVLTKGRGSFALEFAWAVFSVLEESSGDISFPLAALIFSKSLVDILDRAVSTTIVDN